MAGQQVDAQRDIIAEAEHVWAVLADIQRLPKVLRAVDSAEKVAGDAFDVGFAWRESRRFLGRTEVAVRTVTAMEAQRRIVIESDFEETHYRTEYRLIPSGLGTRLRVEFFADGPDASSLQRAAWAVFGKMGAKATKMALEDDLADFAAAAETLARR